MASVGFRLSAVCTRAILIITGWATTALFFSSIGYVAALRRGSEQAWWPSFGYAIAVFSIWALMTWPIIWFVNRVESQVNGMRRRLLIYALGLPVVCALHVFIFAALYWPIYNDSGRIPTRWAMGERMLLGNLDTNALLYAVLVGGVALLASRRTPNERIGINEAPVTPPEDALVIRARGGFLKVPLDSIDRIEAAGDYCQIRAGQSVHLMDETLASLSKRLPTDRFARVHRSTIVALDRVTGLQSVGRGDAILTLSDGADVRLSRRYRATFEDRFVVRYPLTE